MDNKKFFFIMTVIVLISIVDSELGNVADFIPGLLSSTEGIIGFIGIWLIFIVTQYFILHYVEQINKENRGRIYLLNLTHRTVSIAQFSLVGLIGLVILQILIAQEYYTLMLHVAQLISYGLWIITLAFLARAFFLWYSSGKRDVMILILALSMVAYVVNGIVGLYFITDFLAKQKPTIRVGDVAVFPGFSVTTLGELFAVATQIASGVAYVLTWVGTAILLRPYMKKLGTIKFWAIMGSALVYYLVELPVFTLGFFSPSENSDAMTNILIFSLSAIFTGIVFGAAFLSIARTLRLGSAVRNYMIIVAYGFVLFYISGSASVSQAAYPPYGLVSVSLTGLSCYLMYTGLYYSAISVSQDTALRKSIRKSVMDQSKLLDKIGTAQMEREIQTRVITVAKKTTEALTNKTGIQASMSEDEMKDYMELVIKELQSKS